MSDSLGDAGPIAKSSVHPFRTTLFSCYAHRDLDRTRLNSSGRAFPLPSGGLGGRDAEKNGWASLARALVARFA